MKSFDKFLVKIRWYILWKYSVKIFKSYKSISYFGRTWNNHFHHVFFFYSDAENQKSNGFLYSKFLKKYSGIY